MQDSSLLILNILDVEDHILQMSGHTIARPIKESRRMCNRLLSHLHCFLLMPALIFQVSSILTLGLIMLKKLLDVEIQVFYGCEDFVEALAKIDVTECSAGSRSGKMGMFLHNHHNV